MRAMLRDALKALIERDLDLVAEMIDQDEHVDKMWYGLFEDLEEIIQQHPEVTPQALPLLLVARYLERVADHVVNMAERVVYMETGQLAVLAPSHRSDYDMQQFSDE